MTPIKDALPTITDLRPSDASSAAIRAAFYRLRDARATNAAEIQRLERDRPIQLMSSSQQAIDRTDETLRRRRIFTEQCDLAEATLRQSFMVAKEAEEDAEYAEKVAELQAVEAAWNTDIVARYPGLAFEIVELLRRESDLLTAYREMSRMPGAQRSRVDLGATMAHPSGSMARGWLAANAEPASLSDLVRLPGLERGPAIWGYR